MEKNKPENPNAFPDPMRGAEQSFVNQSPDEHGEGMTLRDYFAAKAMQAIINKVSSKEEPITKGTIIQVSMESYSIADAMLKQRNQ